MIALKDVKHQLRIIYEPHDDGKKGTFKMNEEFYGSVGVGRMFILLPTTPLPLEDNGLFVVDVNYELTQNEWVRCYKETYEPLLALGYRDILCINMLDYEKDHYIQFYVPSVHAQGVIAN